MKRVFRVGDVHIDLSHVVAIGNLRPTGTFVLFDVPIHVDKYETLFPVNDDEYQAFIAAWTNFCAQEK